MNQKMQALDIGNARRIAAAQYKARVASGEISLVRAINECDLPITVLQLVRSAPRVGTVRALAWVRMAKLPTADLTFDHMKKRGQRVITDTERARLASAVQRPCVMKLGASMNLRFTDHQRRHLAKRMTEAGCTQSQVTEVLAA